MKVPAHYNRSLKQRIGYAVNASENWVTCAVGNQCSIIKRDADGAPKDEKLHRLGMKFCDDIYTLNSVFSELGYDKLRVIGALHVANETMDAIEARSLQLIFKEVNKQK